MKVLQLRDGNRITAVRASKIESIIFDEGVLTVNTSKQSFRDVGVDFSLYTKLVSSLNKVSFEINEASISVAIDKIEYSSYDVELQALIIHTAQSIFTIKDTSYCEYEYFIECLRKEEA